VCKHPKAIGAFYYIYYRTSVSENTSWSQSNNDGGSKIMQLAKKCPTMALGAIFKFFLK
jgi:hypothetical protein